MNDPLHPSSAAENLHAYQPFNRQKTCRYGEMLYNFNDIQVGRSLDLYGEYCEAVVELFRNFVHPGQIVVEVGSNIGAHTAFLAQQVGRKGAIVAFEPQRLVYQTLCANLALNHISNVHCFQYALGAERGSVVVPPLDYWAPGDFGSLSLGGHQQGERVEVLTLDSFQLNHCHFLKIAVEGMEEKVLRGADNLISRARPILYVENDKSENSLSLVRYIDSLGYTMYWHKPEFFNPANFFNNPENVFPTDCSANMLCIHREANLTVQGLAEVQFPRKVDNP
jgi:FkbM family methyltransferase